MKIFFSIILIFLFLSCCGGKNTPESVESEGDYLSDIDVAEEITEEDGDYNGFNATSDNNDEMADDEPENARDLSEAGTANSYIVRTAGDYSFDATVRGNGRFVEGVDFNDEKLAPKDVKLVWQSDKNGLIDSLSLKDGRIHFSAKNLGGNALVAALDEAGNIIWSWHIWPLSEEIS